MSTNDAFANLGKLLGSRFLTLKMARETHGSDESPFSPVLPDGRTEATHEKTNAAHVPDGSLGGTVRSSEHCREMSLGVASSPIVNGKNEIGKEKTMGESSNASLQVSALVDDWRPKRPTLCIPRRWCVDTARSSYWKVRGF